jgi:hypothetical protein
VLGQGGWNARDPQQFWRAVEHLAERAGVPIESGRDLKQSALWNERQLVARLHEALLANPAALAYATKTRGWSAQTVRAARLGFMPSEKGSLLAGLELSDSWRTVIQRFPVGMLVYPHLESGKLMYLSGRSIEGKKHYNPPREICGERQPYYNQVYSSQAEQVVIVEGQADAVTFGEWGIAAVAIAGMTTSDDLLISLRKHRRVFVALDNTSDAQVKAREIARALKGETYLPQLPEGVKDANEWLTSGGAQTEHALTMLNHAAHWLTAEAQHAVALTGLAREDALRALFADVGALDDLRMAEFREMMAKVSIRGKTFNDLLKTGQITASASGGDQPQVLGEDVPVLPPALGFRRDVAIVTVSITERTKGNRLSITPYLITSTRELRRIADEQILTVNGQEIALKVLPEGSEFLMRWRYSDIKRFLDGDSVNPGDVFREINKIFTTYLDFRSDVESRILSLWTIGTYFYTLFPAYPYLALNGPKNSGKSTVLRVLQPLAFNMVTTSDPTGPSMFRLIHHTSCTVGIDEAERYHNPKDPAMQQIRQLLNSGYKAGMPAIRVTGDDLKPQAFDVYSPKVMAAIQGLEDVLASRCIAIPMRRTDRKMPSFPADFDGAAVRHVLYTLALTHFPAVYTNYFERPELHRLHNRSGELWSPLVALATFFEEQGGVAGLREAISNAAAWDDQISEGKALSDREEAVLQALEMLTRNEVEWIKAADLREQVRELLGLTSDQLGHAQWIGHILNRLQLVGRDRKRPYSGGQMYGPNRDEVLDMMRRYEVQIIVQKN